MTISSTFRKFDFITFGTREFIVFCLSYGWFVKINENWKWIQHWTQIVTDFQWSHFCIRGYWTQRLLSQEHVKHDINFELGLWPIITSQMKVCDPYLFPIAYAYPCRLDWASQDDEVRNQRNSFYPSVISVDVQQMEQSYTLSVIIKMYSLK